MNLFVRKCINVQVFFFFGNNIVVYCSCTLLLFYFSVITRLDSLVGKGYEDVLLSAGAGGHVLLDIVKLVVASL